MKTLLEFRSKYYYKKEMECNEKEKPVAKWIFDFAGCKLLPIEKPNECSFEELIEDFEELVCVKGTTLPTVFNFFKKYNKCCVALEKSILMEVKSFFVWHQDPKEPIAFSNDGEKLCLNVGKELFVGEFKEITSEDFLSYFDLMKRYYELYLPLVQSYINRFAKETILLYKGHKVTFVADDYYYCKDMDKLLQADSPGGVVVKAEISKGKNFSITPVEHVSLEKKTIIRYRRKEFKEILPGKWYVSIDNEMVIEVDGETVLRMWKRR